MTSAPSHSHAGRLHAAICQFEFLLYPMLVFELLLALFAVLSQLFADLDRATQQILYVDLILLGVLLPITVGSVILCRRCPSSSL